MTNEERKYKIFKIFYHNTSNQEMIKELEQSISNNRFIDSGCYNIMKVGKIANQGYCAIQENRSKYSDVMYNYGILLQNMSHLAKELNLENSLELSILFSYLLWHGYLSKNKEYKFSSNDKKIIPGLFFADIMDGRGVCLNNSEMLKDFLNLNEYNSVMVENYYNLFVKVGYKIGIIRENEEKEEKLLKKLIEEIYKSRMANHVFNLIEENNKLYIFDSTNLLLLNIINPYKSELINGKGKYKLFPYQSYMLCASYSEIKFMDKFIRGTDFTSPYQNSNLVAISETNLELLRCSKNLLKDFYTEVKPNIICISKEMNKIKSLTK